MSEQIGLSGTAPASAQSVYSMDEVTATLGCSEEAVVNNIELGNLAALKLGRSWIFPRAAFDQRLNEWALDMASKRREARDGKGTTQHPTQGAALSGRRRIPPILPPLPATHQPKPRP